ESFAGGGNPCGLGHILPGERVVEVGWRRGIDSPTAGRMAGPTGRVVGVDMTPEMLAKARASAESPAAATTSSVEFRRGHAEELPVEDCWADVVISNGVVNLFPDKLQVLRQMYCLIRPGGRL